MITGFAHTIDPASPLVDEIKGFRQHIPFPVMPTYLVCFKDGKRVCTITVLDNLEGSLVAISFLRRCAFIDCLVVAHESRTVSTELDDTTKFDRDSLDDTNSQRAISIYTAGVKGRLYCLIPYRMRQSRVVWGKAVDSAIIFQDGGTFLEEAEKLLSEPIPEHIWESYQRAIARGGRYEEAVQVVLKALKELQDSVVVIDPKVVI